MDPFLLHNILQLLGAFTVVRSISFVVGYADTRLEVFASNVTTAAVPYDG
jgi:hypothetical protein